MSDGGKGSARRKGADDTKYSDGWDRIYGTRHNSGTKRDPNRGSTDPDAQRTDPKGDVPQTGR